MAGVSAWTDDGASRRSLIVDGRSGGRAGRLHHVGHVLRVAGQPARRSFDLGTVALILVAAGALAARRRHPVVVLEVVFGATLVYFVVGYANGPIWLALIVAYVTAVLGGTGWPPRSPRSSGSSSSPGSTTSSGIERHRPRGVWPAWPPGSWCSWVGPRSSATGESALAEATRIREEEALRRASEERLRIARELHDALGHHLSPDQRAVGRWPST